MAYSFPRAVLAAALWAFACSNQLWAKPEVLRLKGIQPEVLLDLEGGEKLRALLSNSQLRPNINGGKFSINRQIAGRLMFVVADSRDDRYVRFPALNAAYDRENDCILLERTIVHAAFDEMQRREEGAPISSAERYLHFIIFHELGHRAVGDPFRRWFYYGGAFLSENQFEELKADEWALRALAVAACEDLGDLATLTREIAVGALNQYAAAVIPLAGVPNNHPSLLLRIGYLYSAAEKIAIELYGAKPVFGKAEAGSPGFCDRAAAIASRVLRCESMLQVIVRLPPGERVRSISTGESVLGILTDAMVLHECPRVAMLGSSDELRQRSRYGRVHTVRRYSEIVPFQSRPAASPQAESDQATLLYLRDVPYVVECRDTELACYRMDPDRPVEIGRFPAPGARVRGFSRAGGVLRFVVQVTSGVALVYEIGDDGNCSSVAEVDLVAATLGSTADVVALRGIDILVTTRPVRGMTRLWCISTDGQATLLVSTSGNLCGYCLAQFGLASMGDPFDGRQRLFDAWTSSERLTEQFPRCGQIADMDDFPAALALLSPGGFDLEWGKWPPPEPREMTAFFDGEICRWAAAVPSQPAVFVFAHGASGEVMPDDAEQACRWMADMSDEQLTKWFESGELGAE